SHVSVGVRNTGNMIAIPHGIVTVEAPNGAVLAQGVFNQESRAVSPGADMTLRTSLTKLGNPILPGAYTIRFTYGLGGETATKTADDQFLLLAWWHSIILLALAVVGWYLTT